MNFLRQLYNELRTPRKIRWQMATLMSRQPSSFRITNNGYNRYTIRNTKPFHYKVCEIYFSSNHVIVITTADNKYLTANSLAGAETILIDVNILAMNRDLDRIQKSLAQQVKAIKQLSKERNK